MDDRTFKTVKEYRTLIEIIAVMAIRQASEHTYGVKEVDRLFAEIVPSELVKALSYYHRTMIIKSINDILIDIGKTRDFI